MGGELIWIFYECVFVSQLLSQIRFYSVQIGAGVSLPGIVAAKCGAQVILSDNAEFSQCLDNCRRSCQMNNLSGICVIGLTWGHVSPCLLTLAPVDLILGADVLFEPEGKSSLLIFIFGTILSMWIMAMKKFLFFVNSKLCKSYLFQLLN